MKLKAWISTAIAAVCSALLPACDIANIQAIKPGITTASEVRTLMGPPSAEFRNTDGSVTLEYTRQPQGVHCYMITIGNNQLVQDLEQVLTDRNFAQAREGMSQAEISRLFGTPASKVIFDNLREEVWEWRVEGVPSTEETYFNVHFDIENGLLKKAGKRVQPRA